MSWIDVQLPEIKLSFSVNHQNQRDKTVRLTAYCENTDNRKDWKLDQIINEKDEFEKRLMDSENKKEIIINTIIRMFEVALRKTVTESVKI